jgi:hypothetical protein
MKLQEIIFKRPIKIFQVFRNISVYGKEQKSFADRKDNNTWAVIQSKSGHLINGELYLPEQILQNPDFVTCDLITMEDDNPSRTLQSEAIRTNNLLYNHCFHLARKNRLYIFEIRNKNSIELHLHYGYFEIGTPERENFKICDLKKDEPVEVKINGKTDFSMSSRRERVFKEQEYIFVFVGEFDSCKILKEPYDCILKHVPLDRKIVNLMKPLW